MFVLLQCVQSIATLAVRVTVSSLATQINASLDTHVLLMGHVSVSFVCYVSYVRTL